MKNFKNIIFSLGLLVSIPAVAMELPPQKAEQNMATLVGLPADVKGSILQHLATADIAETEREILVLAATNKNLINSPQVMIAIFNDVLSKVQYTAHAVQLAQRLQTRTTTLPVMQDKAVVDWVSRTKKKLVLGRELYNASTTPEHHTTSIEVNLITSYLENPNIDLDWENFEGPYKTALIKACHMNHPCYAKLLISAGASIDWYEPFTLVGYPSWMVDKVYKVKKEKLALKQPVKQ